MDIDAKLRPWLLAKILFERTDEEHFLTTAQLMRILEVEFDMPTHRTTIGADIEMLKGLGLDIQMTKSTQNRYYFGKRYFDDAEMRLMIDALASCKFIPAGQSKKLIAKISALAGRRGEKLVRNVSVERRIKGTNKKIMAIIDAINEAINRKKQIAFRYYEYNEKKQKKLRRDGHRYCFSPYRLVWNGDFYYVVGRYGKYESMTSFRVDRMAAPPEILEEDAVPLEKGFDMERHINTMQHMFNSERKRVRLICDNSVMDAIVDRFGEKVDTFLRGDGSFEAVVEVAVNNVLFAWIVGFGGKVKVAGPDEVAEEYREFLRKAWEAESNLKPQEETLKS